MSDVGLEPLDFDLDAMCEEALDWINLLIKQHAENESRVIADRFRVAVQRMHWRHDDLVCLFNARFRYARKQLLRAHYPNKPGEHK